MFFKLSFTILLAESYLLYMSGVGI